MRKAAFVTLLSGLVCLSGWGQEPGELGGTRSYGFTWSYSPDSSHILIGLARQRSTWTLGAEYTHRLASGKNFRLDYEGSILPVFEESDPTVVGTVTTLGTNTFRTSQPPVRVIAIDHGPVGTATEGKITAPIYAIFGRESTYATVLAPLGARVSALPRHHVQPSFSLDLGIVLSARDIPVDNTAHFNYLFSFGPGVEVYTGARSSVRVDYILRHISNAGEGEQNPGIDQGVFRVTLSRHR